MLAYDIVYVDIWHVNIIHDPTIDATDNFPNDFVL